MDFQLVCAGMFQMDANGTIQEVDLQQGANPLAVANPLAELLQGVEPPTQQHQLPIGVTNFLTSIINQALARQTILRCKSYAKAVEKVAHRIPETISPRPLRDMILVYLMNQPVDPRLPLDLVIRMYEMRARLQPPLVRKIAPRVCPGLVVAEIPTANNRIAPVHLDVVVGESLRGETSIYSVQLAQFDSKNSLEPQYAPVDLTDEARRVINRLHPTFYKPTPKYYSENPHTDLVYKLVEGQAIFLNDQ